MKQTQTINTGLCTVKIEGTYLTETGINARAVANADFFTLDEAESIKETFARNMPKAEVIIEPVTEEITTSNLYEAVADKFNDAVGWDYQHNGQSHYEKISDMVDTLENHTFTAKDVQKHVKEYMQSVETPPTMHQIAEAVADQVAQIITANPFEDVTFLVIFKA